MIQDIEKKRTEPNMVAQQQSGETPPRTNDTNHVLEEGDENDATTVVDPTWIKVMMKETSKVVGQTVSSAAGTKESKRNRKVALIVTTDFSDDDDDSEGTDAEEERTMMMISMQRQKLPLSGGSCGDYDSHHNKEMKFVEVPNQYFPGQSTVTTNAVDIPFEQEHECKRNSQRKQTGFLIMGIAAMICLIVVVIVVFTTIVF